MVDARQVLHFGLTMIMLWFSIVLALPGPAMVAPIWRQFVALAPESVWSGVFGVVALFGLVSMATSNVWANAICSFVLGCGHALLAIGFYIGHAGDPSTTAPPGIGTYFVLALFGYYLMIRRILVAAGLIQERVMLIDLHRRRS